MTAWTVTALGRIKSELEANARLASYVDAVQITDRIREDELPAVQRHGIFVVGGALSSTVDTTTHSMEAFTGACVLVIVPWSTTRSLLRTANTVVGVGTSEVGMLQFMEDVRNALRKNELSDLCEATAMEADQQPDISTINVHDRAFDYAILPWRFLHRGAHDPALR